MIALGQMRQRPEKIGHNCSFFIIHERRKIALKLGWGDFGLEDLKDSLFEPEQHMYPVLRAAGCKKDDRNVHQVTLSLPPELLPVYILYESDSYRDAKENGAILIPTEAPATDPNSASRYRDWLPPDAAYLDSDYVRLLAAWTWDGTTLTEVPWREHAIRKNQWRDIRDQRRENEDLGQHEDGQAEGPDTA